MGGASKSQESGQILSRTGCLREGKRCARLGRLLRRGSHARQDMAAGSGRLPALFGPGSTQALAQDYPNRQVNFVVPFAPGGSTDVLGRLVGQKLSERLASRS